MRIVFWTIVALLAYTYLVFPILMKLLGRKRPEGATVDQPDSELPSVAVIVAGYNEELHVAARVQNILEQDYPADRLKLYFGSDGSSDRTPAIAASLASDRVIPRLFEQRRGKASVLNDLVELASEDVLVFSDANTLFAPDAIRQLVALLREPRVGAVCGELELISESGRNPDDAYWKVEQTLKTGESRIGGLLGANGGIYALRRELYRPLPPDTICDDFVVAMRAAAAGARVVYEPAARAFEKTPDHISNEYQRRVRIGLGNYQAFFRYPEFWWKTPLAMKFTYFSHKVLRWFAPHLMLLALFACAWHADEPLYLGLLIAQLAGYAVLAIAYAVQHRVKLPKLIRMPLFLVSLNGAFLVGFWRWLAGGQGGTWTRTARGANEGSPTR